MPTQSTVWSTTLVTLNDEDQLFHKLNIEDNEEWHLLNVNVSEREYIHEGINVR